MKKPIPKRTARFSTPHRPSVRDVARLAGVSVATVSRALSRPELVNEEKVVAVREAVTKLNYVLQGVGRALVSRRTHMIGGIIPSVDHAMFAKTAFALQTKLAEQGYMLALACSDFDTRAETVLARRFIERGTDGIVLFGRGHEPELLGLLESFGIPYIATWAYDPGSQRTHIGFDNRKAASLVVDHLVGLGHRDIAIVSGQARSEWQRERLHWLRSELDRHGIHIDPSWIVEGSIGYETGRAGILELVSGARKPSAVICGHDIIAVGALAMCHELGIAIPSELAITGFEDLDVASNVTPPLTTVRFPVEELGVRAGEEILKRIAGEPPPGQIELPIVLMARETTAPIRKPNLRPRVSIASTRRKGRVTVS